MVVLARSGLALPLVFLLALFLALLVLALRMDLVASVVAWVVVQLRGRAGLIVAVYIAVYDILAGLVHFFPGDIAGEDLAGGNRELARGWG